MSPDDQSYTWYSWQPGDPIPKDVDQNPDYPIYEQWGWFSYGPLFREMAVMSLFNNSFSWENIEKIMPPHSKAKGEPSGQTWQEVLSSLKEYKEKILTKKEGVIA